MTDLEGFLGRPGGGPPPETGMGTGQAARVLTGRLGLLKL